MKNITCISIILMAILISGCYTTGLSPREVGGVTYTELVYGLHANNNSTNQVEDIEFPIRLAVAQVGETTPPKQLLTALAQHSELIQEVIETPLPGEPERYNYNQKNENSKQRHEIFQERVQTLVSLSKQLGANYVFMVGGNIDSRQLSNPIEILDIAIVPAFIIPSKKIEAEATASGAFIDVKTGKVICLVNATSEGSGISPSAYVDQKRESISIEQGDIISKQIADELIKRLQKM